ncbi:MAG: NAD(P)-dependent oxidoreductase [Opitutales bacterium]
MTMPPLSPDGLPIAFIGTGVMGSSMAGHLRQAGCRLTVFTRTRAKAQPLLDAGARWAETPAVAASGARVVFSIVGFPDDVASVYLGETGILSTASSGTILVDMTTSRPDLAQQIADVARDKGCSALDAPVSGGDIGAREARLSIMVGGDEAAFHAVRPLLELMGQNIVYHGLAGSGQHTKMANQIVIASSMMAICEALVYAKASGLDPDTVLQSISGGAAASWSLSNLAPRILKGDFAPGFYVKHFLKDLNIALESAQAMGLQLPGLAKARELYQKLYDKGFGDEGTQALHRLYADRLI